MKSTKPDKYGIGCLIADCVLIVETVIDIQTGRLTWFNLLMLTVLGVISLCFLRAFIKRKKRKERDKFNSTRTEGTDSTW